MIDLDTIKQFTVPRPETWSLFGTAKEFDALPGTHKEQILFLDPAASNYLYSFSGPAANLMTGDLWDPFAKGNFQIREEFTDFRRNEESSQHLKKWLYQRGIPFATWVFVLPNGSNEPVLTTWKIVVKYAPDLFLADDVMVFDRTLNWCLFFFHEDKLFFGKDNCYDPAEEEQRMKALNERKQKYPQFPHPYL